MKLVSIIMPAFNSEATIESSVKSVLKQTHQNFELIIIADDKKDYQAILSKCGVEDNRIKFYSTGEVGSGAARARNIGLNNASANILMQLDSDDTIKGNRIATSVAKLKYAPVVSTAIQLKTLDKKKLFVANETESGIKEPFEWLMQNYSSHSILLWDKRVIGDIRYDCEIKSLEDHEFSIRLMEKTNRIYHINDPLFVYDKNKKASGSQSSEGNPINESVKLMVNRLQTGYYKELNDGCKNALLLFHSIFYKIINAEYDRRSKIGDNTGMCVEEVAEDIFQHFTSKGNLKSFGELPETVQNQILDLKFRMISSILDEPKSMSWVKVPTSRVIRETKPKAAQDSSFMDMIDKVHKFSSGMNNYDDIQEYCNLLNEIRSYVDEKIRSCGDKDKQLALEMKSIAIRANKKIVYLKKIKMLHDLGVLTDNQNIFDPETLKAYTSTSKTMTDYKLLSINSKTHYDDNIGKCWGNYPLEIVDPSHRQLEHYVERWSKIDTKERPPFFVWLEEKNLDPLTPTVSFLPTGNYELTQKKGKLYNSKGNLVTTGTEGFIFIVSPENKIYSVKEKFSKNRSTGHISLSHGNPVIAAGKFIVKEGLITELKIDSGHYLPNLDEAKQMIKVISDLGINLKGNTACEYYPEVGGNAIKCTVKDLAVDTPAGTQVLKWSERNPSAAQKLLDYSNSNYAGRF